MLRRNVGLSSLERHQSQAASYNVLSDSISQNQLAQLSSQMSTFQAALRLFASKHRAHILKDAQFRQQFSAMCAQLGVDPLGGGKKALWDFVGLSDWTFALAIQVVDVCMEAKERNGGLIDLKEVQKGVMRLRTGSSVPSSSEPSEAQVTESDIMRALKVLEPLGCGYAIVQLSDADGRRYIRCIPQAFDQDSMLVLECCAKTPQTPFTTFETFYQFANSKNGWSKSRADAALKKAAVEDGLVWIDDNARTGQRSFWATSLVTF